MLASVTVANFILIDKLEINFQNGFNAITGETGAGKSIILDAIAFALGGNYTNKIIRIGAEQAIVTLEFTIDKQLKNLLDENGFAVEDNLYIKRVINSSNRKKSYLNDQPVTKNFLNIIFDKLVEFNGQNNHNLLSNQEIHIDLLDEFGNLAADKTKYQKIYQEYKRLVKLDDDIKSNYLRMIRDKEYFDHCVAELKQLNIQENEEEEISNKRAELKNKAKYLKILDTLEAYIGDGEYSIVKSLVDFDRKALELSSTYNIKEISKAVEICLNETSKIADQLSDIAKQLNLTDESLDEIEDRFFKLKDAARKYNKSIDELPKLLEEYQAELDEINNKLDINNNLEANISKITQELKAQGNILTEQRKETASKLEKSIAKELKPLMLNNAEFKVQISELSIAEANSKGLDKVEFLARTNKGMHFGKIDQIASGGELSRFLLAIKLVLLNIYKVPIVIYDEIDTGIGGATAEAIGKRLSDLGKEMQIFAITHQPQVASCANHHFKVKKFVKNEITYSVISELNNNDRIEEIARMISGADITKEAKQVAKNMIEQFN